MKHAVGSIFNMYLSLFVEKQSINLVVSMSMSPPIANFRDSHLFIRVSRDFHFNACVKKFMACFKSCILFLIFLRYYRKFLNTKTMGAEFGLSSRTTEFAGSQNLSSLLNS